MGARPDDLLAFYQSDLGRARVLPLTAASAQIDDDDGPLEPGRYLFIFRGAAGQWGWFKLGAFEKGTPMDDAGIENGFPLSVDSIQAIEVNIRRGHNDRVAGILEAAGAAKLYMCPLSVNAKR